MTLSADERRRLGELRATSSDWGLPDHLRHNALYELANAVPDLLATLDAMEAERDELKARFQLYIDAFELLPPVEKDMFQYAIGRAAYKRDKQPDERE